MNHYKISDNNLSILDESLKNDIIKAIEEKTELDSGTIYLSEYPFGGVCIVVFGKSKTETFITKSIKPFREEFDDDGNMVRREFVRIGSESIKLELC